MLNEKEKALRAAQAELATWPRGQTHMIELGPAELQCMIAAIQVACRHPLFIGPSRLAVESITRQIIAGCYANHPAIRRLLEMGWETQYDDVQPLPGAKDGFANVIMTPSCHGSGASKGS